ncbi:MAG TPA: LexA family transcriptional regulator [Candidatus Paceibacterota bacterium]|nr:LexA family transcriptional regulator [Candidatus Paceibacterota bacterium]
MSYDTYKNQLAAFYRKHKRLPGYKEIMAFTGFRSKNAVFKFIQKLVDDGIVKKDSRGRLSPYLLAGGARLLGLVEAGFPSAAEEELLDVMDFDEFLTPNKESSYILRVKGDSMIDAGIREGDMVIAERRQNYKPGQIVIAMVDGEYTMKYLRKKGEGYYLEAANDKYPDIYPTESFKVEAVVTGVVRKY